MSDIKTGDLVMVVKPISCCGSTMAIGRIATIIQKELTPFVRCRQCGLVRKMPCDAVSLSTGGIKEKSRLIKIDPPKQKEEIKHREGIS